MKITLFLFADRYSDSKIIDSYGPVQWPRVCCIDFWVYVDRRPRRARINVEVWGLDEQVVDLTGDGYAMEVHRRAHRAFCESLRLSEHARS